MSCICLDATRNIVCNAFCRTTNSSSSCCDDKENLPSSEDTHKPSPREIFPTEPWRQGSALGNEESSRILGKRRGNDSIEQEFAAEHGGNCSDVVKKQRVEQVSVSVGPCVQLPTTDVAVSSVSTAHSATDNNSPSVKNCPLVSSRGVVTSGSSLTTVVPSGSSVVPSGRDLVSHTANPAGNEGNYSQNSVGRDIAAEFDSLFSPEILLKLDNDPQLKVGSCDVLPVTTTVSTAACSAADCSTTSAVSATSTCAVTEHPQRLLTDTITTSAPNEHPLPTTHHEKTMGDEIGLMQGLFGGVASDGHSGCTGPEKTPTRAPSHTSEGSKLVEGEKKHEEEDLGLQRAMEESLREQVVSKVLV